jgi:hypothetical protein
MSILLHLASFSWALYSDNHYMFHEHFTHFFLYTSVLDSSFSRALYFRCLLLYSNVCIWRWNEVVKLHAWRSHMVSSHAWECSVSCCIALQWLLWLNSATELFKSFRLRLKCVPMNEILPSCVTSHLVMLMVRAAVKWQHITWYCSI